MSDKQWVMGFVAPGDDDVSQVEMKIADEDAKYVLAAFLDHLEPHFPGSIWESLHIFAANERSQCAMFARTREALRKDIEELHRLRTRLGGEVDTD